MVGFLVDNFLVVRTILNLNNITHYSFSLIDATGSSAKNRFSMFFLQLSCNNLPLTFILLSAKQTNGEIAFKWIVNNEENTQSYQIEQSINGLLFTILSGVGTDINIEHIYYWENIFTSNAIIYFRVKSIDKDSSSYYTPTLTIAKKSFKKSIGIFSNPVKGNEIKLTFNNQPAGNYSVLLINYNG